MDPFMILLEQHHDLFRITARLQELPRAPERASLVRELREKLEFHTRLEHLYVYSMLESYDLFIDSVEVLRCGHEQLSLMLHRLMNGGENESAFIADLEEFSRVLRGHLQEEETRVFPAAREQVAPSSLAQVQRQLTAATQEPGLAA